MNGTVRGRLRRLGRFLRSGWAGLLGLALFATLWQAGSEAYGDFILPSPLATLASCRVLLNDSENWHLIFQTILRALEGYALALAAGVSVGLAAGYFPTILRALRPILTILIGVPPIAWIVLTMIWFGSSDGTVIITVTIATTPLILISTAEGVLTRDPRLDAMAQSFGAGPLFRLYTIGLRQVAAFLFPVLSVTLGSAVKIAVMAELLSNIGGIGGALAMARSNLDVAGALAWVLIAVACLILLEYLLLRPIQTEFDRWRGAARSGGMNR
ncbi:MAG: ABC transporter permease subunit [Rhodospirillaceae bacterium]|nr:ABC transporter permease subunit [Rhodospirillaceae bacterium]